MNTNRVIIFLATAVLFLTLLVSVASAQNPPVTELQKYMIIAMASDDDTRAFQTSNAEIGANRIVLSTNESAPWEVGYPNLVDVFGDRWNSATNPDQLNGAALVVQGIDWTGNIALTSDNGVFDASNSLVFADRGIESGRISGSPIGSVDEETNYYPVGEQTPLENPISLSNGVSIGHDFTALLDELQQWKEFIDNLEYDYEISDITEYTNDPANNGDGGLRTLLENKNPSEDDFIVVDFNVDGDFSLNNVDWVVDAVDSAPVIFRILNGSNMKMENSSILMAEDDFDPEGRFLGGTFYHASDESGSGDTVFTIGNNTILNGIGIWDFNAIGEGGSTKTNININNGQGCSQFISQAVNFQNGRWARCVQSPTALALGPLEIQSTNDPYTILILGVGLLLAASVFVVLGRIRRSES